MHFVIQHTLHTLTLKYFGISVPKHVARQLRQIFVIMQPFKYEYKYSPKIQQLSNHFPLLHAQNRPLPITLRSFLPVVYHVLNPHLQEG